MVKPLILIDGSSYFYRAFHAMPPLSNSKGIPTGAVYGVINMIRKLIKDYEPEQMAVVFDAKGKTFRDDLYPEYKANREAMPSDLRVQFEPLANIIEAMGLPVLIIDGVEADDVIGTLAHQASERHLKTVISTGDKDMAQLVNEHVSLINTMTNKAMDTNGVIEKFGVEPSQIIDYLTLIGDKVDNVPGVDKVGPKTAVKWLAQYQDLDSVMANAHEIGGKVGENLRSSLSRLPLSRTLVTIKCDVELQSTIDDLVIRDPDTERLITLYRDQEFKGWLEGLLNSEDTHVIEENKNYETILTQSQFDSWLTKLKQSTLMSIDTETTGLDNMVAELVGLSFCVSENEAAYLPLAHDYEGAPDQLGLQDALDSLKPILEDPNIIKIGQNIKYDLGIFERYGLSLQGVKYDTMLESYVLNSGANRHDMDSLALKYLGKSTIHFEDVAGKGVKQKTFNQIDLDVAAPYAAEDADITLQLHQKLHPMLSEHKGIAHVFNDIEIPLLFVIAKMERIGVLIDAKKLDKQSDDIAKRLKVLETDIYELSGEEFNINSTKQLQVILFEKLGLPILQKTPKGQASTAEAVMQELAHDYPLPKLILEHRSLRKLKSTYTDSLPQQINSDTGRVHTSYNQAVTSTGRLSSTEPNLQNIPIRTEEGRKIREAFIAPPEFKLISADYSQIELRIMAHLSEDQTLLKAFENNLDVHSQTASDVFNVPLCDVSADQRRSAKAINFGLIYGMSAFGLAKQLECDRHAAQQYIDVYFDRYPGVKAYMDNTREKAHELGYVETIHGRRLYLPEINAKNIMRQKAAERAAINAPLQGSAADIIKIAMLSVDKWLTDEKLDHKMIMQVHDELILEVHQDSVQQVKQTLKSLMCKCVTLKVPLEVDIGTGDNWDEAH